MLKISYGNRTMDTSMCVVNIPTLGKIISFEVPRPIPALMG